MAPNPSAGLVDNSPLRAASHILNSAKDHELPSHVISITTLLTSSPILDDAAANSTTKSDANGIILHKFKTRLSALLQSKSAQARWCGIVLVKAAVESSFECLSSHGAAWTRLMLPLLTRPEPPATHKAVLATLSTIFTVLTSAKPTLTREITTPNLPAFLTNTIALCSSSTTATSVLANGLTALLLCLKAHPVTYRPFATKTQNFILNILSTNESTSEISSLARRIFVSLPLCVSASQKRQNGASTARGQGAAIAEEWSAIVSLVIEECHLTLDRLFRSVVEDSDYGRHVGKIRLDDELKSMESKLGLKEWTGMRAGVARVQVLLALVADFFAASTTVQVNLPYGAFLNLCSRIFAVVPPAPLGARPVFKKKIAIVPNTGVEKSERDQLLAYIPTIHTELLKALDISVQRLSGTVCSFGTFILEQLVWIFTTSAWNINVRTRVYAVLYNLLKEIGPGLQQASLKPLSPVITTLLSDLLPSTAPPPTSVAKTNGKNIPSQTTHHADSFLANTSFNATSSSTTSASSPAAQEASHLLTILITHLPNLRSELRTQIDRTAILISNKEAILASTLYPPLYVKASLMPFLQEWEGDLEVEGCARPRVLNGVGTRVEVISRPGEEVEEAGEAEEDDDESESEDEVMVDAVETERAAAAQLVAEEEEKEKSPDPKRITPPPAQTKTVFLNTPATTLPAQPTPVDVASIPSPKRQKMEPTPISVLNVSTKASGRGVPVQNPEDKPAMKPVDLSVSGGGGKDDEDSDLEIPEINMEDDTSDEEDE